MKKKLKVSLSHRHYGKYSSIREILLDIEPNEIIKDISSEEEEDYEIDEDKLLDLIPKGFLPCQPKQCLVTVDVESWGTGIRNLKKFRNFAKYFDSYAIGLEK